jgi:hypothetical protein
MTTTPIVPSASVQDALARLSLSVDSLLVNGIPLGVFQRTLFPTFLDKPIHSIFADLSLVEDQMRECDQGAMSELTTPLRANCGQLVDLVRELRSFQSQSLDCVQQITSQILQTRNRCQELIHQLRERSVPESVSELVNLMVRRHV